MDEQKMQGLVEEEIALAVESAALTKKLRTLESQVRAWPFPKPNVINTKAEIGSSWIKTYEI